MAVSCLCLCLTGSVSYTGRLTGVSSGSQVSAVSGRPSLSLSLLLVGLCHIPSLTVVASVFRHLLSLDGRDCLCLSLWTADSVSEPVSDSVCANIQSSGTRSVHAALTWTPAVSGRPSQSRGGLVCLGHIAVG